MINYFNCIILIVFGSVIFSCSESDNQFYKENGTLLWINGPINDHVIKYGVQQTLENSSVIIAQIPWSPNNKSFFNNIAWYFSLAKDHGKKFMIAIDWQNIDRSSTNGDWGFTNHETAKLFKSDMLKILNVYNPDIINLGVEVNYFALTYPKEFRAFAKVYREIKKELKQIKPDLKIGLSYQLELLYGHHKGWNETNTLKTLDNMLGDIDYLGISTYPNNVSQKHQNDLFFSLRYLDSISKKYSLPIGISETGVSSKIYNNQQRASYVKSIFQKTRELNLEFVIWGSILDANRDSVWYDKIGIIDKDGRPKNEFSIWQKEIENFKR